MSGKVILPQTPMPANGQPLTASKAERPPLDNQISQLRANKIIAWLTGLLTLLLAIFAFVLSFNALTDLAAQHGVSIPPLFPFVVEFAVIIFSLNALYRSLSGEGAKVQWLLIIGSSLLAGLFNIAHAAPDFISRAMAAMPSLFLLLSFESFLSLIKNSVTRQGINHSLKQLSQQYQTVSQDLAKLGQQRDTLQAQIEELSRLKRAEFAPNDTSLSQANDARQAAIELRREQVLSLINQGMSQSDIANELGVSLATIKRDTRSLNGKVRVS